MISLCILLSLSVLLLVGYAVLLYKTCGNEDALMTAVFIVGPVFLFFAALLVTEAIDISRHLDGLPVEVKKK